MSELPYRLGVGMVIVNRDGKVFVGKRIDTRADAWQMPQGGIDQGEDPETAAWRELKEEVGTANVRLLYQSAHWYHYNFPEHLKSVLLGGQYRGQKQRWFAFEYLGRDEEIDIHTHEPEFEDWKWVDFDTLPDLIIPFKRDLYQSVVSEFKPEVHALLGIQ